MKKNDLIEMKNLDEKALTAKIKELKVTIADRVVDKQMNKMKDLKTISKHKKEVAQLMTVLRQKELIREYEQIIEAAKGETK